ncbi:MAG: Biotin transporter BioY [Candidatus Erwinia impunctatus]
METRDIVFIALFAAIVAALGAFPPMVLSVTGVPITAQTLGPMMAGGILGARRGAISMALFVLLVALGLPLLSGGRGGLGVFVSPTGGYLLSWMLAAFTVGWIVERCWQRLTMLMAFGAAVVGGIVVIYAIGIPWSAAAAHLPLSTAAIGALPFLVGDVTKALIAAVVIMSVKRTYPLIRSVPQKKPRTMSGDNV